MNKRNLLAILLLSAFFVAGLAPTSNASSSPTFGRYPSLGLSPKSAPRTPKFTSVYTNLRTQCRSVATNGQGDDPPMRCTGFGGYLLVVDFSAASSHLRIEPQRNPTEANTVQLGTQPIDFNSGGKKLEWRLADGKPFAVIMRMENHKDVDDPTAYWQPQNRLAQTLLVQGLGGHSSLNSQVDATKPSANADARKMADDAFLNGACN